MSSPGGGRAPRLPPAAGTEEPAGTEAGQQAGPVRALCKFLVRLMLLVTQHCLLLVRKPHDEELVSLCPYKF